MKPIIKKLDKLCREICRERDKVCVHCGLPPKDKQMDWTHYITRSNYHTRWNLDNVMMMHRGCHQNWAHKHHEQFTDFMMKNLGDRYILLRKAACDTSKLDYKLIEIGLFLAKNTLKLKNLVEDF